MKYNKTYLARRLALSLIIGGMFVSSVYALPQGGTVVGGSSSGTIGGSGNIMDITGKGSNNVAIRWEQFNIANGETVNFTNMANVLNYVTGNTKSEIYGALNGQGVNVFLFNPNGILFGKGAAVNVGSLHASTGKMTDENINGFNGTPTVDLSNVTADVLNLGVIRADKVTIEGANISLGNAADIQKQNGDAITAADKANYVLKADGVVNVGYETTGTKTITIVENGTNKDHTIRDYNTGAAATGSTLFTGSKLTSSEDNTINDCMLISNIYELQNIPNNIYGKYMLAQDISADISKTWNNGAGFKPLCDNTSFQFKGIFDGVGYAINNLYINDTTGKNTGLFGQLGLNARVSNVGLENSDITGVSCVGGIVGFNAGGTISNVYNKGSVTLNFNGSISGAIGGIVGKNGNNINADNDKALVENAVNFAKVSVGETNQRIFAGGVVGSNYGTVKNAVNEAIAKVSNNSTYSLSDTGGVIGYNNKASVTQLVNKGTVEGVVRVGGVIGETASGATVSNAINIGNVTYTGGPTSNAVGGIIGYHGSGCTLQNVRNEGIVTGIQYVGGIVGYNFNNGVIKNSYNEGVVAGTGAGTLQLLVGGIVGNNAGIVTNVYNTGAVSADKGTSTKTSFAGGIVAGNNGTIKNAYNMGLVTVENGAIGKGIVAAGNGTITNAFYFDPSTQHYYDDEGTEYTSTEAFNQAFMTGAAVSGEQAAWLGYSDGQTTPQLQAFLSPLDVSIGNIEVEITDGDTYTGLAQAIIDKLTTMGVEFDATKIKAVEVKEAGTYDLSSLLYSTQDGYKITISDGGKLTITVNAKKPDVPPVINSMAYQIALINIQHVDDDIRVVQQNLESEKYAEDEDGRVKIVGTGIKI